MWAHCRSYPLDGHITHVTGPLWLRHCPNPGEDNLQTSKLRSVVPPIS
jgi:hypothetical protein